MNRQEREGCANRRPVLHEDQMSFEDELIRARREGVRREENLPFFLEPQRPAAAAVLLVHGFTASPWEMRRVAEALVDEGYVVYGIRLPGHGTTPEDLAGRRCEEWLAAVESAGRQLREQGLRVYGVGQSTGGLLLLAADENLQLDGLVLLSPYLRLRHRLARTAVLTRFLLPFQRHRLAKELMPFYYERRPVEGVYQLSRLIRMVKKRLPEITVPSLIVSAAGDRTVDVDSAKDLFRRLGGATKEYHLFGADVSHILTTDENPRLGETLSLIRAFLRQMEQIARSNPDRSP